MYSFVLHQSQCTNNCVFCNSREFGAIDQNIQDELQKLKDLVAKGEEIKHLEISGNDPGEYPKLPDVIKKIREVCNPEEIILTTHGKTLTNEKFVKDLLDTGITKFTIALYGHNAETHDAVAGCEGSFEKTMNALITLHSFTQNINITSLITKENQHAVKNMLGLFSTITNQVLLGVPCYVPGSRFENSIPDFNIIQKHLSEALEENKKRPFHIIIKDIPYCLLGGFYEHTLTSSLPEEGYEHWRDEKKLKSGFVEEHEGKIVPLYRMMSKTDECKKCKYQDQCCGFYTTYIREGHFSPKAFV